MTCRPVLTEAELEAIIANWSESEDEFDDNNDADIEVNVQINRKFEEDSEEILQQSDYDIENQDYESLFDIANIPIVFEDNVQMPNAVPPPTTNKKKTYPNIIWHQQDFLATENEIMFRGTNDLPDEICNLTTPYSCFNYLFGNSIVEKIVEESNLYSCQTNLNNSKCLTSLEIRKYLGICILMSIIQIPDYRRYWGTITGNEIIKNTMSVNNFDKVKQNLHFNNNEYMLPREHEAHDRLFKLRPTIDMLLKNLRKVPMEQYLAVDEQLCSTKAKHYLKQYLANKPHKWGYKLFVLSGESGFSYNFEIYTGQENDSAKRLAEEEDLGASANTVIRLLRPVPKYLNYRVYFDNYYSSIPLVIELTNNGMLCLGTIRRNRISNCKLPNDKEMKKDPRGTSIEYVGNIDGKNITTVAWKDTKIVNLISNYVGRLPLQTSERFDKKLGQRVIECPSIIKEYNSYMGGVDKLDSLIGRYKIKSN